MNKKEFKSLIHNHFPACIDDNKGFFNLSKDYWVYDELLFDLKKSGWFRFAPGFKAGLYGTPSSTYCIKLLGMGVGENPKYFCERGYYLEHERNMLIDFYDLGFHFGPRVMTQDESIDFLIENCKVRKKQAELRVLNNDLIIMEYIHGIPLATQTGKYLNYNLNIIQFERELHVEMYQSLKILSDHLNEANNKGLLHNDPVPPNIVFTIDHKNRIEAKLVDFELSQNISKISPEFVNKSVEELYRERDVPINAQTMKYKKNLDQHLMDESIGILEKIISTSDELLKMNNIWDSFSLNVGPISVSFASLIHYISKSKY